MQRHRTFKVWLGVGAAAVLGSAASGVTATPSLTGSEVAGQASARAIPMLPQRGHGTMPFRIAASGEGGEGGEAGGGEASGVDPRVAFLRDTRSIAGHVKVADELIAAGQWAEAAALFRHALEAVYPRIVPALKQHQLRRFDRQLKSLAKAADEKSKEALADARAELDKRLSAADAKMREYAKPWGRLAMQGVREMLRAAATEYQEAIDQGRIAKTEEYQVGRGYVLAAEKLLGEAAADLEAIDKSRTDAVRAGLAELKRAWPGPMPPVALVKDHSAVLAAVSRIELAAGPLLSK